MGIGCVVLASGESVRFGSNKLLADFCGKPVLAHLFGALPPTLSTVVVTRSDAVQALAAEYGFHCLLHREPEVRDTIRLGLLELHETQGCLFCVGDQPLLTRETLEKMILVYETHPKSIVRAAFGTRQGNPVLFAPSLYPELLSLAQGEAGVTVIRRHADSVRTVEAAFEQELTDVDTPETLQTLAAFKLQRDKE